MKIIQKGEKNVKEIITALKNGAVLVCPTDTVYGFICDATNKRAVGKIFKIKKRDKSKSLPVFVRDIKMAKKYAVVKSREEKFLNENWPGAVTVVLNGKKGLSLLVYKNKTIALRQPNHNLIAEIFKKFKRPLAQTSVNISDQPFMDDIKEIVKVFDCEEHKPDLVIDAGHLPKNKPSVIIDLTDEKINIIRK
ncbi:MAG: L-threonylcarbamoyladenylate synthase [Candidatus Staskawiczbacteria bacterium]|nr:L-threonylcarbamoyladenylate synthase [Candidatus Staskawiczbacteria bacterium]